MWIESPRRAKGDVGGWIHRVEEGRLIAIETQPKREPVPKLSLEEIGRRVDLYYHAKGADDARRELSVKLGVSVESLEALEVGIGYDYNGAKFWSFPERDIRWRPIGVSRRYEGGAKKHLPGTTHGLYMAREWWRGSGPILLPEGGSDTAALLTLGLCAVGRPSNIGGVNMLAGLLVDSGVRPIVVLGENDRKPERVGKSTGATNAADGTRLCPRSCFGCQWCWPGKYGMEKTAARLTLVLGRQVYCRLVHGEKDVREWLQANGADRELFAQRHRYTVNWLRML